MSAREELNGRSHRVGWGCGARILLRVIRGGYNNRTWEQILGGEGRMMWLSRGIVFQGAGTVSAKALR